MSNTEEMERSKKCSEEVNEVLKKHNCILVIGLTILEDGRIIPQKQIIAKQSPIQTIKKDD